MFFISAFLYFFLVSFLPSSIISLPGLCLYEYEISGEVGGGITMVRIRGLRLQCMVLLLYFFSLFSPYIDAGFRLYLCFCVVFWFVAFFLVNILTFSHIQSVSIHINALHNNTYNVKCVCLHLPTAFHVLYHHPVWRWYMYVVCWLLTALVIVDVDVVIVGITTMPKQWWWDVHVQSEDERMEVERERERESVTFRHVFILSHDRHLSFWNSSVWWNRWSISISTEIFCMPFIGCPRHVLDGWWLCFFWWCSTASYWINSFTGKVFAYTYLLFSQSFFLFAKMCVSTSSRVLKRKKNPYIVCSFILSFWGSYLKQTRARLAHILLTSLLPTHQPPTVLRWNRWIYSAGPVNRIYLTLYCE